MAHAITKDWMTEAGLHAVVLEVQRLEHWFCGYVAVGPEHPLFGKGYGDESAFTLSLDAKQGKRGIIPLLVGAKRVAEGKPVSLDMFFDVHGSLTYSGDGMYPVPTEDGSHWWFGFDAHHAGDSPDVQNSDYVAQECESLAKQLVEYAERLREVEAQE